MKILFLTAYFPPELGSASNLFYQLGTEFVRRGHKVTVLTHYPSYNIKPEDLPIQFQRGKWMREQVEGMNVIRVRNISVPRHIPVLRGMSQLSTMSSLAFSGLFLAKEKPDVILVYSPPLFIGLTALLLRFFKARIAVMNVQDLFPQSAIDLGVLKSPLLIKIFRWVESYLYCKLDAVTVHSEGNRQHVINCRGRSERAYVIPNLIDTNEILPGAKNNEFRKKHNISPDKIIISFAGVLGYSQDLDTVIDSAKLLQSQKELLFLIVGDGVEKERLMKKADGISNVQFLPMIPKNEYIKLLHASDICLATLHKEVKTPVVPSKILSIMSASRAVIAGLPLEGDAPQIIKDANCGISVPPEDVTALAEAIKEIIANPALAEKFGANGRKYVVENFSLELCTTLYERLFNELLQDRVPTIKMLYSGNY